jgi:hypothetical protein
MNDKQPNKQKWLTDKLSGEWMDKDAIIETVLVECLRHFVEEEKGLVDPSELHPDDRNLYMSQRKQTDLQERFDDLSSTYAYIVEKYDNADNELSGFSDTMREMLIAVNKQTKQKDEAIAKIWRHYQGLWT